MGCSFGSPLSYSSPKYLCLDTAVFKACGAVYPRSYWDLEVLVFHVVVFLDRVHPCFWNFNSAIPLNIVWAKSYVNCYLFYPARLPVRITINKLYFISKPVMFGVVGVS